MDEAMSAMTSAHRAREMAAKKEAQRVRKLAETLLKAGPFQGQTFSTVCASRDGRSYVAYVRTHGMRKELKDLVNYANYLSSIA
jgi:hypothetical protein